MKRDLSKWVGTAVVSMGLLLGAPVTRAGDAALAKVQQAKELLDTYYGSRENLRQAAVLLEAAYNDEPRNAAVFVEAARVVIMGGHIFENMFVPNTLEFELALLDRATKLDPLNHKAYILRSEAFRSKGDFAKSLDSLEKAKSLKPNDPWLLDGLASHYLATKELTLANTYFEQLVALGPGTTSEQRKAYVSGLTGLAWMASAWHNQARLREIAALAMRERHPKDAWTLGAMAVHFAFIGMFDDAIVYSGTALETMNYGHGRVMLATSLYGKAAQLMVASKATEARPYVTRARSLGVEPEAILRQLSITTKGVRELLTPTVKTILAEQPSAPAGPRLGT